MRGLRVAIVLLLLISLIAVSNAQQTNYAGAAKIVLQITGLGFDQGIRHYHTQVLYSYDPAIKVGQNYDLDIAQFMDGYWGMTHMTPAELMSGTIIGIDDYSLDGNTITVTTSANLKDDVAWNNAWKQKIKILNGNAASNGLQIDQGSLFSRSQGVSSSTPAQFNLFKGFPASTISSKPTSIDGQRQSPSNMFVSSESPTDEKGFPTGLNFYNWVNTPGSIFTLFPDKLTVV